MRLGFRSFAPAFGAVAIALLAPCGAAQKVPPELLKQTAKAPPVDTTPSADEKNRVVVGAMVPIPDVGEGAPLFTATDLQEMHAEMQRQQVSVASDLRRCLPDRALPPPYKPGAADIVNLVAGEKEYLRIATAASGKAEAATERAEAARRAAYAGTGTMDEVIALELERQEAVSNLQKARADLMEMQAKIGDFQKGAASGRTVDWLELEMNASLRRQNDIGLGIARPREVEDLHIVEIRAQRLKDTKGGAPFVRVTGKVTNSGDEEMKIPPISISVVDDRGWVVATQTMSPEKKEGVRPNAFKPFQVDVRPAPDLLQSAVVSFASSAAAQPRLGVGQFCVPELGPPR